MKKNLRLLCLGLAAATFTASFAQAENVTSKLVNADMEKGVIGWTIDFDSHIWKKNTKSQAAKRGFHGVTNTVLENWKSDATSGLTDNTISQTVTNLPNGTYVFGAYIGASQQGSTESNRESVTGVTLFANEGTTAVATDNPDNSAAKYAHTAKFNVAATVTDGTLNVGLKAEATNANYLVMDNATLYYFGDMDAAAALDEMAKIDMAATVAIADTCFAHKMNVDSLALITEAKAAAEAVATADAAWQADEDLYWAIFKATKSISDYRSFNNAIAAAEVIAAGEWSEQISNMVDALNASIVAAKATYEEATKHRPELNEEKTALNEAAALVALDSSYVYLDWFDEEGIYELPVGDAVGEYSDAKITALELLSEEARFIVDAAYEYQMTAVEARHKYDSLYAEMQAIIDNPNTVDTFPIVLGKSETALKGYKLLDGATTNESDVVTYESKLYTFDFPLTRVRFIVKETGSNGLTGDYPFFSLSSFEMFDAEGNEIDLTTDNLTSNACHNTLNSNTDGSGIPGLIDDEPGTFFHSTWGTVVNEHHYLEVTLPAGEYTAFSFVMTARGTGHPHQFPAVLEITHLSDATSDLLAAISSAKTMNAYQGTAPGFYKEDLSAFYAALATAEALTEDANASESDIYAAITALEDEQRKIDEMNVLMPEAGKKYQLISAGPFFGKQGIHKAITVHSDSTHTNWLWWETAAADSAQQYFSFEYIPNAEGKNFYAMKHEATGLYVGSLFDAEGETVSNAFGLNATPDTVELAALGYGQFGFVHENHMMHAGDHNSGVVSSNKGAYGGTYGVASSLVSWTTSAYNASAWYIREVHTLPYATKSISDLNFVSESINLYAGINTLVLEADKDCAFADFVAYDVLGNVIKADVNASGKTATVMLDTAAVESFSFAFTNAEGVASVTINGSISKLSELQAAYNETLAINPEEGHHVGQYSDLDEYNAALKNAETILASGGSDDEIVNAIAVLDSAVAHLQVNLPKADKTYFIISGFDSFNEKHGVDMALYVKKDGTPAWSYVGTSANSYLWKFIQKEELVSGEPAFYLQNVASETYMGSSDNLSVVLEMAADTASTKPFRIDAWGDGVVTICDARYNNGNLHFNGHGGGSNAFGNIVYWSSTTGTASAMRIVESAYYIWQLTEIEDIEIVDEYVAPAQKGIYDLFGRRISTPAATGIYIVDGKKRVIKK